MTLWLIIYIQNNMYFYYRSVPSFNTSFPKFPGAQLNVCFKEGGWVGTNREENYGKEIFLKKKKKKENRKEVTGSGMGSTLGGQEMIQSMK